MLLITFLLVLVAGFLAGQLVNYLADILPRRPVKFTTYCSFCEHPRKGWRYILLQRCSNCFRFPDLRHWLVAIVIPLLFLYTHYFVNRSLPYMLWALLIVYLATVFLIDLEHRLVLHSTSLVGFILCGYIGYTQFGIAQVLFGAFTGFAIMYILYLFGILFVKVINKRREEKVEEVALGFGDVTLATVLGAVSGFTGIISVLLLGIILGGLISGVYVIVTMLRKQHKAFTALPYAPFLILSFMAVFFR
ncbi:MAG TPA: prepilin peptidase [Chloroflexi bacterium]|nr:prepilin peptidase [Chloroflexota bacterium]